MMDDDAGLGVDERHVTLMLVDDTADSDRTDVVMAMIMNGWGVVKLRTGFEDVSDALS